MAPRVFHSGAGVSSGRAYTVKSVQSERVDAEQLRGEPCAFARLRTVPAVSRLVCGLQFMIGVTNELATTETLRAEFRRVAAEARWTKRLAWGLLVSEVVCVAGYLLRGAYTWLWP